MYKRVMFGAIKNTRVSSLRDLGRREFVLLGAMAVLVLAIGVRPKTFTDAIGPATENLVAQAQGSALPTDTGVASNNRPAAVSSRLPG
jgi:NADH-quinone oxidoreductase subunit M